MTQGQKYVITINIAHSNDTTYIICKCKISGIVSVVIMDRNKYLRWYRGELIQNVWPNISPTIREIMVNGTHPVGHEMVNAH